MRRASPLAQRARTLAAFLLPILGVVVPAACSRIDDDNVTVVCTENLTNDAQLREIVQLRAGRSTREYDFQAFQGATYTAAFRVVDGSASWSLEATVRDEDGQAYAVTTVASPDLGFAFSPPGDGDEHTIRWKNTGASTITIEVRGLAARGSQEDTGFALDIHFAGPLGYAASEVSATAQDLAAAIRPYFEEHGIGVGPVRVFSYTTAELRSRGIPTDRDGDAALSIDELDSRGCGAGAVIVGGLGQLGRLARDDDDAIDLVLVGTIEGGVAGVASRGGNLRGHGESSVVAVEVTDFDGLPRATALLARVAAHEIGHFLSLAHTADYDASSGTFVDDGLPDTPSAQSFVDRDGDGFPGLGEGCPDESLVMFPRITGGCLFSRQQVDRMRAWLSLAPHDPTGIAAPTPSADLAFDTIALPEAYADHAFNAGIAVRGGTGPVTVTLVSGTLPQGLVLDGALGRISGETPDTGEFRLVLEATDAAAASVTRTYLLEVRPGVLAAFYAPRTTSRPDVGADVLVAPFRADGTPRTFVVSATGGEGRYLFDCAALGGIDPLTGALSFDDTATGVVDVAPLVVHDVNREEEAVLFAVGE